jgi:hypothetical protein
MAGDRFTRGLTAWLRRGDLRETWRDAMPRNYDVGERAIMVIGALAGKTLAEVNTLLAAEQKRTGRTERQIPPSTWNTLNKDYVLWLQKDPAQTWARLWELIQHPPPWGNLDD